MQMIICLIQDFFEYEGRKLRLIVNSEGEIMDIEMLDKSLIVYCRPRSPSPARPLGLECHFPRHHGPCPQPPCKEILPESVDLP